jgi:predicted AlkP superfamily phosphohydrolase/phosphomutase
MLMSCLSTPDRVQHMMYQYYDKTHPMYDAAKAAQTFTFYGENISLADTIPATYRHLDKIVGNVMEKYLKPGDTLIVCGDHGFQSFRRQVALNNWLLENGYLALKGPLGSTGDGKLLDLYVDWSKTKAYALGLGGIYVNLKGREGHGIVAKADMDALLEEIKAKLLTSTDPKDGKHFVKGAYKTSEIHSGDFMKSEADLLVGFDAGWRISWNTTSGGLTVEKNDDGKFVAAAVCSDNAKTWSGDHVSVDPSIVPCIFFCNRHVAIPSDGVSLLHIAPTVLGLFGVPTPKEYDKPALAVK